MPTLPDATRATYATLLAAYRAEPQGGADRLIYAQHIVERLLADDVFGRLRRLRDRLDRLHAVKPAEVWLTIEQGAAELGEIAGETAGTDS